MISFACKQIHFKDLLHCSFNLNKTEYDLFTFLLTKDESLCVSTIGEMTGKDRTTVQKAIKKLIFQDLVLKHQVNLENGGYTFVYKIKDKEVLRNKMLDIVQTWHTQVVNSVKNW
jgi:predicted transcriptional regulator